MAGRKDIRAFWLRLSAGLTVQQLWTQFLREAHNSMAVYATTADPTRRIGSQPRRGLNLVVALFQAMFEKLSPARRVLLFIAILFLLLPQFGYKNNESPNVVLQFPGAAVASVITLVLLGLELADRVAMKRDLEIARDIQKLLLPAAAPECEGVDIAFMTRPANTVAGDYYDVFLRSASACPGGWKPLLLLIADVAGKGIPAGMLMATLQASVHTLADEPEPLPQLVAKLNRCTCSRSGGGQRFITGFFAELDPRTHVLSYVNAGHDPPIVVRCNKQIEKLREGGLMLGFLPEAAYNCGQTRLERGDVLYLFTDGVVEAVNRFGAEYGEGRLEAFLRDERECAAADRLTHLVASVDAFTEDVAQYDDITCLIVRVTAAAENCSPYPPPTRCPS